MRLTPRVAGFRLEYPAGFELECMAGFVGTRNKEKKMSENLGEFERLLGHAALRLWSELPREVQENLFETAVPLDPVIRNRLAIFLHDRHPRTAHPPKPTELA
jgi:hypothetical protein